jgi:hypothetical protein
LPGLEGFRETEATPPCRHIDHLPTRETCLIRNDYPKIHNHSHRPPWFSPKYLGFLFGQLGYCFSHGEFLLAVGIRYIILEQQLSCRKSLAQQYSQIREVVKVNGYWEWEV